ncbi:hypothetical protein AB6A40_000758 [Gnathostoma spinigerum]|uniref:Uncharacterized protein n=1 Tax=Gnathostoma spinigerum TaxID=75299 RepID=A0ABD6E7A5_9BILA
MVSLSTASQKPLRKFQEGLFLIILRWLPSSSLPGLHGKWFMKEQTSIELCRKKVVFNSSLDVDFRLDTASQRKHSSTCNLC